MKEKLEPYQKVLKGLKEVLPKIPDIIEENERLREENERLKKGLGFDLEKYKEKILKDFSKEFLKEIDNHLKKK